ncbi:50S ribosomal protein L24 [Parvularcula dongshanensis]|uniref:Large ribosomal subunit protein uL24 n=1 Tax=Parvularcula dongshanensis TaxID=1173995 RepID=A0A840I2E7_9PROT|nr:50S ribosomal protein L24 [Parvularcula dongshanensis]MBB4658907.1 large subunit ribosomal protein L24 [Parvularcula dongshanensis]
MAAKIKKGDTVVVLAGKDRGAEGQVLRVLPKEDRCVVQGVNRIKRHTRPSQSSAGGIVEREASIHLSNVALKDPKDGKPTRVGFEVRDGKKVRIAKRTGEVLDV